MNYWLRIFRQSPLFASCDDLQIESCLKALDHSIKSYKKNETIFMEGAKIEQIGLVLKGTVRIESVDYEGAVHLYTVVEPSFCFGETYAFLGKTLKVSAIANTDCFVFLFSIKNLPPCILENLLRIALLKNEILSERIEHASKKTIRKKSPLIFIRPKKRRLVHDSFQSRTDG